MTGPRRGRLVRRLLVLVVVPFVLLIVAGLAANLRLMAHLDRVPGAFDGLAERPAATAGTTILLLGTVTDATASGPRVAWLADQPALESVMLVEVPRGTARHVYVQSLPISRDLASSVVVGRAGATVGAVEAATGRRVEHLAVVDWSAFQQLAADSGSGLTFEPGSGIAAQQAFLQQVLADTLHAEMRKEPWTLYTALDTVCRGMAVDGEWTMVEMDLLVLSLRDLRSAGIDFGIDEAHQYWRMPTL